jgi:hypothetical protein
MTPKIDRRKFFSMFAAGAVGMSVADKVGFFDELKNWTLSPSKSIFIPAEPATIIFNGYVWQNDKAIYTSDDKLIKLVLNPTYKIYYAA